MYFRKNDYLAVGGSILGTTVAWLFLGGWGLGVIGSVSLGFLGLWFFIIRRKTLKRIIYGLVNILGQSKTNFSGMREYPPTPAGAPVYSPHPIPDRFLQLYDENVMAQIRDYDAVYPGWSNYRKVSDYPLVVTRPQATTDDGSPALLVSGFKMVDGIVAKVQQKTSGTVIGLEPHTGPNRPHIVIASQESIGWSRPDLWGNTAYNESEHAREKANSETVFQKYAGFEDTHRHTDRERAELGI